MYKIEIQQVSNGWICSVSLHKKATISSSPMNGMFDELLKNIDGPDKLRDIQENNEYTGIKVFLKYGDMIGFLNMITE